MFARGTDQLVGKEHRSSFWGGGGEQQHRAQITKISIIRGTDHILSIGNHLETRSSTLPLALEKSMNIEFEYMNYWWEWTRDLCSDQNLICTLCKP